MYKGKLFSSLYYSLRVIFISSVHLDTSYREHQFKMSAIYKKRFEIIFFLVTHPKGPKMSVKEAAKYTKTSVTFVRKWIKRYKDCGNVDDKPGRGHNRGTSKRDDKVICELFKKNPTISLRQAKQKLIKKGVRVSLLC